MSDDGIGIGYSTIKAELYRLRELGALSEKAFGACCKVAADSSRVSGGAFSESPAANRDADAVGSFVDELLAGVGAERPE